MAKIQEALSNKFTNMSFLCACLVVFIHLWFPVEPTYGAHWWGLELGVNGVSRMAVPYFFLAAGYFLAHHCDEEGWWGREVRKRVRSLLVPMFLWSFLYAGLFFTGFVAWRVLRGIPVGEAVGMYPIEWLRVLCLLPYRSPFLGPLWFLRGLFVLVLLSPLLVSVIRRGRKWGLLLLGVCFCLYLAFPRSYGANDVRNFFRFFLSVEGLVYFTLGLFLYRWPVKLRLSIGGGGAVVGRGCGAVCP